MSLLSSKQKMVLLIASLGVAVLFCFQNCSQGLYQLAASGSAQAKAKMSKTEKPKTDFDDLLLQSERELNHTQNVMKSRNDLSPVVPTIGRFDASGSLATKNKEMKIKLYRNKSVKKKSTLAKLPAKKSTVAKTPTKKNIVAKISAKQNIVAKKSAKKSKDKKISLNEKTLNSTKSKRTVTVIKKASVRTPAAKSSAKKIKSDSKNLKNNKKKKTSKN